MKENKKIKIPKFFKDSDNLTKKTKANKNTKIIKGYFESILEKNIDNKNKEDIKIKRNLRRNNSALIFKKYNLNKEKQKNSVNKESFSDKKNPEIVSSKSFRKKLLKKTRSSYINDSYHSEISNLEKTIFEQISTDLTKIKLKTNKTLNIMQKNIEILNKELFNRATRINILKMDKNSKKYKLMTQHNNTKNKSNIKSRNLNSFVNTNLTRSSSAIENKKSDEFIEIPKRRHNLLKTKTHFQPLYKTMNNFYKNMFHFRNLNINDKVLLNHFYRINTLGEVGFFQNSYIPESNMQTHIILNKISLINDNINFFKVNYMNTDTFNSAFDNMENQYKAKFNIVLEEICVILIKIVPKMLKKFFYGALDIMLYASIPDIKIEMEKKPENEKECLNLNLSFFNLVYEYFTGCIEIFQEIIKKMEDYKFSKPEYDKINIFLDLARNNTSKLNLMAKNYILKNNKDKEIFDNFEIGIGVKQKCQYKKNNIIERFIMRQKNNIPDEHLKMHRINVALDSKKNYTEKKVLYYQKRFLGKSKYLLNSSLVANMMKYFKRNAQSQIIAQQVVDRYRNKE